MSYVDIVMHKEIFVNRENKIFIINTFWFCMTFMGWYSIIIFVGT